MIHLPQEIWDKIIDKVANDALFAPNVHLLRQNRDTLRACALVCTLWTARAQKALFRTLEITFVLHDKSFNDPFGFPFYKGLRKRTHLLSLRYVLDVIKSLRAVEQLEVDADLLAPCVFMPLLTKDVYSALLAVLHLPSLTTLRFSEGVVADLFALLRECPQITRLVVGPIFCLGRADVATLVPPKLDSLVELVCHDKYFLRRLETLFPSQQMINYRSLRYLHFGSEGCVTSQGPDDDSRWIAGVLRRLDGKLQHLSLCIYPTGRL
ncbi:hypothetical protein BDZ89DRAFT_473675 [Hymenopellis radicata]|nr:hypothetical protein BDZ89DRAFT_473675 [Hymenopellis radicata]